MLARKNSHPRDKHIQFFEDGHIYDIDGDRSFVSVTSFIKWFFKEFDADKAIENIRRSKNYKYSLYYDMNKRDIKKLWSKSRDYAANRGTTMHKDIEDSYNLGDLDKNYPEFNMFLDFNYEYIRWTPYRTEWFIYDKSLKIAGSIDMLYYNEDTGKYIIVDWKRSKDISFNGYGKALKPITHIPDCNGYKYALQLNIYKYILETKYGIEVEAMYLLHLHEKNVTYKKINVPELEHEVRNMLILRKQEVRVNDKSN